MKPSVPLLCHAQVWAGIGMGQGGSQPHAAVLRQAPTIGIHWASLSILKIDGNCKKLKPPTTYIIYIDMIIYVYNCVYVSHYKLWFNPFFALHVNCKCLKAPTTLVSYHCLVLMILLL